MFTGQAPGAEMSQHQADRLFARRYQPWGVRKANGKVTGRWGGGGCEGELCPGLACLSPSPGILMVLQALGANVGHLCCRPPPSLENRPLGQGVLGALGGRPSVLE